MLLAPLAGCSVLFGESDAQSTDAGGASDGATPDASLAVEYEPIWQFSTGPSSGYVVAEPDGSAVFAGGLFESASFEKAILTPVGPADIVLVRVTADGALHSARLHGGQGTEFVTGAAMSPDGRLLVTGGAGGLVNLVGGTNEVDAGSLAAPFVGYAAVYSGTSFNGEWGFLYGNDADDSIVGVSDITATSVFVCGRTTVDIELPSINPAPVEFADLGTAAGFHVHYNSGGAFTGTNYGTMTSAEGEARCEVAISDGLGAQYLMGSYSGEMSFAEESFSDEALGATSVFVSHLTHGNEISWTTLLSGNTLESPVLHAEAFSNGDVAVAVQFAGGLRSGGAGIDLMSGGAADVALYRFSNATGEVHFAKSFPSAGGERPFGLAVGPNSEIAIVGTYTGTINFGGDDLVSVDGNDAFVAIFDEDGNHIWSEGYGAIGDDSALGVDFDNEGALYVTFRHQGIDVGLGPLEGVNQGVIVRFEATSPGP